MKKAKKIIGSSPTREEYDSLGLYPSYDTIIKNFESYNAAKRKAGLKCYADYTGDYKSASNNYGPNWNQIRASVFDIHNHQCLNCGINRDENFELFGKDMTVHHVVPYKEFKCRKIANHKSNLTPLCHSCHAQMEAKNIEIQCDILQINKPVVEKYTNKSTPEVLTEI